ncbi:MAG: hypothetical protein GY869_23510, partial [Planctomycetes bacterium]|nr:hypothetical protein [Planctomycetota bacterium]
DCDDSDYTSYQVLEARDAGGIPVIGQEHPYDPWLFLKSKECSPNAPHSFVVTCNYESIEDPTVKPTKISMTFSSSNEPIDKDNQGDPILMSNDEAPDPPLTKDVDDQVYRFEFSRASFDDGLAAAYNGAINSDAWQGFTADKCKVITFSGTPAHVGDYHYYDVVIEIQIRDELDGDNWMRRFVDQGYREKSTDSETGETTYNTIVGEDGNPLSQPTLLDGDGCKLAEGADPVYREYYTNKRLPFAILNTIMGL